MEDAYHSLKTHRVTHLHADDARATEAPVVRARLLRAAFDADAGRCESGGGWGSPARSAGVSEVRGVSRLLERQRGHRGEPQGPRERADHVGASRGERRRRGEGYSRRGTETERGPSLGTYVAETR